MEKFWRDIFLWKENASPHHGPAAQLRFLFCRGWKLSSRPMNSTKTYQKTFGPISYIGQFVGHKSQASHLSSHPSSGVSFFTKIYDILICLMNIWIYLNISWCILLYLTFFGYVQIYKVDSLQNRLRLLLRDGWGIFFGIRLLEGAAGYQIDFVENPLLRVFQWSLFSIL